MFWKTVFIFLQSLLLTQSAVIELPLFPTTNQLNLTQIASGYREVFYEQLLDHFNFNEDRTFQQRFLLHDEFFDHESGAIFFYAGSQENILQSWNNDLFILEHAPRFKALVVFAEHRYYGRSLPFGNRSLETANIAFLSVEQALADYSRIIKYLQDTYKAHPNDANLPVIVFGASYGGLLAAHMRLKYSNLIDGAVSTAAPMNVVSGMVTPNTYYREITKSYSKHPGCVQLIRSAFDSVTLWYRQPPVANNTLVQKLRLCRQVTNNVDFRQLLLFLRNGLSRIAVHNYPYASSASGAPLPANPVKFACDSLTLNSRDPLGSIKDVVALFYNATAVSSSCFDIYNDFVECSDSTGCSSNFNSIAFDYQSCTEMPIIQESNSLTDMFPALSFTAQTRRDYCKRRWNVTVRDASNKQFWNHKIAKTATNIVFVDSTNDPWQSLGIDASYGDSVTTLKISDGAHRIDFKGTHQNDPTGVRVARLELVQNIAKWINDAKANRK